MRNKKRIPIFIKYIDLREYINSIYEKEKKHLLDKRYKKSSKGRRLLFNKISNDLQKIYHYWMDNPDLRFPQVLICLDIIDNSDVQPMIYYEEDEEILLKQGVQPRDCLFWGRIYDKDGNRLPETEYILIKNLSSNHILNILFDCYEHLYTIRISRLEILKNEIKLRKSKNNEITKLIKRKEKERGCSLSF